MTVRAYMTISELRLKLDKLRRDDVYLEYSDATIAVVDAAIKLLEAAEIVIRDEFERLNHD